MIVNKKGILFLTIFFFLLPTVLLAFDYQIKKGDTLYSIALKNNVSVKEILDNNKIKDKNKLFVGENINIPNNLGFSDYWMMVANNIVKLTNPLWKLQIGGSSTSTATLYVNPVNQKVYMQNPPIVAGVSMSNNWKDSGVDSYQITGNVGIGTNAPTSLLDINGTYTDWTGTASRGQLNIRDTAAQADGVGGRITFGGKYSGSTYTTFAGISGEKDTVSSGSIRGRIVFSTAISGGTVTEKMRLNTAGNLGIGTTNPVRRLSVWDGDAEITNTGTLGSETLTNPNLTGGTSWSAANDCTLASDAATWTYSAGTASTLTQTSATLAVSALGSRWYAFTYTVSDISGTPAGCITTSFASATTCLTLTAGTKTLYFKSATTPTNFVITSTLTAGQAFTLDTFSLKEVQSGDVIANGQFTGGGTSGIKVLSNGNVGIGTTSPLTKLTVVDTTSNSPRGILSMQYSNDTNGARVGFAKARGTATAKTTVQTGDMLGRLMFRGYDGSNFLEMASIDAGTSGTIGTTRVPTYLSFSTATDAAPSVLNERIRITDSGNVGIGTTTPVSLLHVAAQTGTSTATFGDPSTSAACLKFEDTDKAGYTYCTFLNGTMTCSDTNDCSN